MNKSWSDAAFLNSRPIFVPALIVLLLLIFAGQLLGVARLYSANWDEAHHLYDGYNILTTHDYRVNAEVPPLVKVVAALPLLPLRPSLPADLVSSHTTNAFLDGRTFVFSNGGDRLLFPARIACTTAWLRLSCSRKDPICRQRNSSQAFSLGSNARPHPNNEGVLVNVS